MQSSANTESLLHVAGLPHKAHISHLWWSGLTQAEPLALGQYQAFTSVICFLSLWYTVLKSLSPRIIFKLFFRSLRKSSKFLQALSTVSWCAHHVLSWDNIRVFLGYHSVDYLVATWTCCLQKTVLIILAKLWVWHHPFLGEMENKKTEHVFEWRDSSRCTMHVQCLFVKAKQSCQQELGFDNCQVIRRIPRLLRTHASTTSSWKRCAESVQRGTEMPCKPNRFP